MSEVTETNEMQDELAALKARADLLGISYHPTIGLEKLRQKVNAAVTKTDDAATDTEVVEATQPVQESEAAKRLRLRNEAAKLIRIRLTCLNPVKKEWDGEIITAGNAAVGTYKKFIPFHSADDGWHIPHIIYEQLMERMCQIFVSTTDPVTGIKTSRSKLIKEFNVVVLPQLTDDELAELARQQAVGGTIE